MKNNIKEIPVELFFQLVNDSLKENKNAIFTVTGNSMWPFIGHGRDQVEVVPIKLSELKKGDIVLFKTPGGAYILHRIMKLTKEGIITSGDGNTYIDGEFSRSSVLARVSKIIRKGKTLRCESLSWRIIFTLWRVSFPIRPFLLKTILVFCRIRKKIKD